MNTDHIVSEKRILTFDILNIISCLGVIALHHNGLIHSYDGSAAWKQSLVAECLFYWCVPVFLMLSGANLINYRQKYSTKEYFKKRLFKAFIPWLAWSVIFLIWKLVTKRIILEPDAQILQCLSLIINNQVMSIYWFFNVLFACYLVIPILSLLTEHKKILWYIVGINYIFVSSLPLINNWVGISWNMTIPFVGGHIIFVVLGFLLKDISFTVLQRVIIYILGAAGAVFHYIYIYILSGQNGFTDTTIKGYQYFHSIFLAVAIFVLANNIKWERIIPKMIQKYIPYISSLSFGIYLIHYFVLTYERNWLNLDDHRLIWRTICILLTYIVSAIIVAVLKKIPLVKKIVP